MNPGKESSIAILLADLDGNQGLQEKLGAAEAQRAAKRCLTRTLRCIEAFGGHLVSNDRHRLTAIFASADNAFQAAIEIQEKVSDLPPVSGFKLAVRISFAYGPGQVDGDRITGEAADSVIRLAQKAAPGQILACAQAMRAVSPPLRCHLADLTPDAGTGKLAEIDCFKFTKDVVSRPEPPTSRHSSSPDPALRLQLQHAGKKTMLQTGESKFTIGRDEACNLVIHGGRISRRHAAIYSKNKQFILKDLSTNGTFVKIDAEPEIDLQRMHIALHGKGTIALASSAQDADSVQIEFELLPP